MIDTSEILVSKEHIDPLRDQGFVIYKLGRITPVEDGRRYPEMLLGNVRYRNGLSAYEVAVVNGFSGTQAEWLASLVGDEGAPGAAGADADTSVFQVHVRFEVIGAKEFECPFACKFTAMIHQQTNTPTLSTALNTNMAQYDILTVTADAIGMVTLTGTWL